MDGQEIEGTKNGVSESVVVSETTAPKVEKPWIAAGFKTRDEWRASKGQKTGKPKKAKKAKPAKKTVAAKSTKKPAKKVKKSVAKKVTKKVETKSTRTAKERAAAAERTAKFKKALAKRTEPNEKEAKVLAAFGGIGKEKTIAQLGEKAFPNKSKAVGRSWVRNCLRWCTASKHTKIIDSGLYRRIA